MRHTRLTWPGAFHHVMNRGHGGERVLATDELKQAYLQILQDEVAKFRIPVHAYCLMDNHFHLIVENTGGVLSRFMRAVHTRFGFRYRHAMGGRGYVFQDRFKSTLIQNNEYLLQAVLYVLTNPVRAGLARTAEAYPWSSAGAYFDEKSPAWLEKRLVEKLLETRAGLRNALEAVSASPLNARQTRFGPILGDGRFAAHAEQKFNRRKTEDERRNARHDDQHWEPVAKVLAGFEQRIGRPVERIDTHSYEGKRQRGELLVLLKDLAGLTYQQVMEFEVFRELSCSSLGHLYQAAMKRQQP